MSIKVSMAIFILLSFLNMGAISNDFSVSKNTIDTMETNMRSVNDFEENGVKLQYRTKENLEEEVDRVKNYLIHNISGNFESTGKDQFKMYNTNLDISVKMWCEDNDNYIEITLINRNSKYSIRNIVDLLQELINEKSKDVKYFSYCEGKIINSNYSVDKFISDNNLQRVKKVEINNGCTGIGYLSGGDKINFALIKYNTGSHIIIGTPVIFTTY